MTLTRSIESHEKFIKMFNEGTVYITFVCLHANNCLTAGKQSNGASIAPQWILNGSPKHIEWFPETGSTVKSRLNYTLLHTNKRFIHKKRRICLEVIK